jgi:hypothetical protein
MNKTREKIMIIEGKIELCEGNPEQLRQHQRDKAFLQSELQQLHAEKLIVMQSSPTGPRK